MNPSIRWMFHATAIVGSYATARSRLTELFGLCVLEYGDSTNPGVGRRGGMTWVGDNSLELGEPSGHGAVERFVRDLGGGMHSVAVQVASVDETLAHVEATGVHVAARPRQDFCFTAPRDTAGVLIQWSEIESHHDPRFGTAIPPAGPPGAIDVVAMSFVGAVVADPAAAADHLARLVGTRVTFSRPDAPLAAPRAGVSLGDCTLALFGMPGPQSVELYGRVYLQPRTHLLGLQVADLTGAREVLRREGVRVLHDGEDALTLDPPATGGVQIQLGARLPPNDPRTTDH